MSKVKEVHLTLIDRVNIMPLLERKGKLAALRIVKELADVISLEPEELELVSRKDGSGMLDESLLNENGREEKTITLSGHAFKMIEDTLRSKEKAGELEFAHLPLYEKFCEDNKE